MRIVLEQYQTLWHGVPILAHMKCLLMFLGGLDKSSGYMHINYHGNEIHYFIVYMHWW